MYKLLKFIYCINFCQNYYLIYYNNIYIVEHIVTKGEISHYEGLIAIINTDMFYYTCSSYNGTSHGGKPSWNETVVF